MRLVKDPGSARSGFKDWYLQRLSAVVLAVLLPLPLALLVMVYTGQVDQFGLLDIIDLFCFPSVAYASDYRTDYSCLYGFKSDDRRLCADHWLAGQPDRCHAGSDVGFRHLVAGHYLGMGRLSGISFIR